MRTVVLALAFVAAVVPASGEVVGIAISSRSVVANGQAFGDTGPYEKLVGRIEFALDPTHPRNQAIVDLGLAPTGKNGKVHFSADLFVLQPVDRARGNGTLLFEIANRGRKNLLAWFNDAPGTQNPDAAADFGDGFLLRQGYTLVWVGWQFDVPGPLLTLDAPRAELEAPDTVNVTFIVNAAGPEATIGDLPDYRPVTRDDPAATLTVRDRFWEPATPIARERWRFASLGERPRLRLDPPAGGGSSGNGGGFEPGRIYELTYRSHDARVAGAGFAAIRDAASAFVYRDDLPVRGERAYVFGISQSGRFLRQFLAEGFNLDEEERQAFQAVWPHIAGAGLGSFNERFAMPGYSSFTATRFPFTDAEQAGPGGQRGGILAPYDAAHQPKVMHTNSSVEYWGQGRAAALTHTAIDGTRDVELPANVRSYLLASTQHTEGAFPPSAGAGQQLGNPMPQRPVLRALLQALHHWVVDGTAPPASRVPRLTDDTLARAADVRFPAIPGVADPRTAEGPGIPAAGGVTPLPFLVPQVDEDGNELAGIRVPEVAVPLATATGWNFRSQRIGGSDTLLALAGSYIPFPRTRAARESARDPRPSIEERYGSRDAYLARIDAAIAALVKDGFLLAEDAAGMKTRAAAHWDYAMSSPAR